MLRRLASIAAVVLAATACSGNGAVVVSSVPAAASSARAATLPTGAGAAWSVRTAQVWFVRDGRLFQVQRQIPFGGSTQVWALRTLMARPSAADRRNGVTSALPAHTRLLHLSHRAGVATVDVSAAGGGLALAQLVYTVTQAQPIHAMRLELDGVVRPGTLTRSRYASLAPLVQIAAPSEHATMFSPVRVSGYGPSGTTMHVSVLDRSGTVLGQRYAHVSDGRFEADVTVKLAAHAGRGTIVASDSAGGSARLPVRVGVRPLDVYWPGEGQLRQFDQLKIWVWDNRPEPGPVEVIVRGANGVPAGHRLVLPYPCSDQPCPLPVHLVTVPFSLTGVQYGSIEIDTLRSPEYTVRIPHVNLAPGHLAPACAPLSLATSSSQPFVRAAHAVSLGAPRYLPTSDLLAQLRLRAPELGHFAVAPDQHLFVLGGVFQPPTGVTWLGETPDGQTLAAAYACGDQGAGRVTVRYPGGRK
jgi:hypothetical protein